MNNIYKVLQVKILLNWTRIIVLLYIANIFLYNPTLCTNVPYTVSEWVRQNDVAETVAEWEAKYECDDIYRDPSNYSINHEVPYSLHDTKDPAHHNVSSSLPISTTFEDAPYNQHDTSEVLHNSKQKNPVMQPSSLPMKPDLVHEPVENVSHPERLTSATQATQDTQELQREKAPLSLPTLPNSLKQLPVDTVPLKDHGCSAIHDVPIARQTSLVDLQYFAEASPNSPNLPTAQQSIPTFNLPMVNETIPALPVGVELWRTEEGLLATLSERYKDITIPLESNTTSEDSSQAFDMNNPTLNEQLSMRRGKFIDDIVDRTAAILVKDYPNLNPDNIPDNSIKNATRFVLNDYGDKSEWLMKTRKDLEDPYHEGNLRTRMIQNILANNQGRLNIAECKILCHIATLIIINNTTSVIGANKEYTEMLLNGDYYDQTYTKFIT